LSSAVWFLCRACGNQWSVHPGEASAVKRCPKCHAGREKWEGLPAVRAEPDDVPTRPDLPSTIPPPAMSSINLGALVSSETCAACGDVLGEHPWIEPGRAPICRPCAKAPRPALDLGAVVRDLEGFVRERRFGTPPPNWDAESQSAIVTPAQVLRFLRGRGLTGVDVVVGERGDLVLVPKIVKLAFHVHKIEE